MKFTRRKFLGTAAGVGALSLARPGLAAARALSLEALTEAGNRPVLQLKGIKEPVPLYWPRKIN